MARMFRQLRLWTKTSDPGTVADGDVWYRSDTDDLKARINGVSLEILPQMFFMDQKTATGSTINSTTLVDCLTVTLSNPGTYVYRGIVVIIGNATTSDAGFALGGTSTPTAWRFAGNINHPATIGTTLLAVANGTTYPSAASSSFTIGTTTGIIFVEISGTVTISAAGTFKIRCSRTAGFGTYTFRNGTLLQMYQAS